jgi:hypothetical protein
VAGPESGTAPGQSRALTHTAGVASQDASWRASTALGLLDANFGTGLHLSFLISDGTVLAAAVLTLRYVRPGPRTGVGVMDEKHAAAG